MTQQERYVIPNPLGSWYSKKGNAERASKHFETKKEAMAWSREKAKAKKSELIPHGKDGKIQNPNIYGNDSNPSKDKKH